MNRFNYHIENAFLSEEEHSGLERLLNEHAHKIRLIPVTFLRRNKSYRIFDGEDLRSCDARLISALLEKVKLFAEEKTGESLVLLSDIKRNIRIHIYENADEGILWHIDEATFTALITLRNETQTGIDVFNRNISKFLLPMVYAFYWLQSIFLLFLPKRVILKPRDMILIAGSRLIHRAFNGQSGSRAVLAVSFHPLQLKVGWFQKFVIWLNVNKELVDSKE